MYSLVKIQKVKSSMKVIIWALIISCFLIYPSYSKDETNVKDIKAHAYALYETNNKIEALKLINTLPVNLKDEECYVIIANIYEDWGKLNLAIEYLNKAILTNPKYYKAYYNLGCIFLKKKAYALAEDNLKLAIKYKNDFAYSYYNLGCVYLNVKDYKNAKKNFIRAITYKNDEKDFYLNLAYANKMLGKEKEAKRILDIYNQAS